MKEELFQIGGIYIFKVDFNNSKTKNGITIMIETK